VRRYAIRLLLFLLPLALGFGAIELGLRRSYDLYAYNSANFRRHAPDLRIIVTGSSHEQFGIRAAALGDAFNLALPSQTLLMDRRLVERYLAELPRLEIALLGVTDFSFGISLEDHHPESWRLFYYQRYWDVNGELQPIPLLDSRRFSLYALYGHARAIGVARAGFPRLPPDGSDDRGFSNTSPYIAEAMTDASARRRTDLWAGVYDPGNEQKTTQALLNLIAALRARGVTVAVVEAPLSPAYRRVVSADREVRFRALLQGVLTRTDARLFDYSADGRFVDRDFTDADHLNRGGAEKYTGMLAREVLPALRAPRPAP
jgi:hypothetical protein